MSLLNKEELQDICGHTALRARKWSGSISKRAPEDTTISRSIEERRRRKKKNAKTLFFTSRGAYVNCAIVAMLYTHSIGNQP